MRKTVYLTFDLDRPDDLAVYSYLGSLGRNKKFMIGLALKPFMAQPAGSVGPVPPVRRKKPDLPVRRVGKDPGRGKPGQERLQPEDGLGKKEGPSRSPLEERGAPEPKPDREAVAVHEETPPYVPEGIASKAEIPDGIPEEERLRLLRELTRNTLMEAAARYGLEEKVTDSLIDRTAGRHKVWALTEAGKRYFLENVEDDGLPVSGTFTEASFER